MGDQEVLASHHRESPRAKPLPPQLLLITDHTRFAGDSFFASVEAALRGGTDAVLAREKQMDSARLLAFCARLRSLTRRYGARLLVHTQADVALAVGADGVHVGAADIGEIAAMRGWLNNPAMTLSASCHDAEELRSAAQVDADFALLSPVFATASHPGAPHLGEHRFRELADVAGLPIVALGGITTRNRYRLAGFPVAVIGALLGADDPRQAALRLNGGTAAD